MQLAALAVAAAAVAAVVAGCGSSGGGEATGAGSDWSTNGGTMSNQRYSTLDDIDTSNVSQLKGVWRTHLNGSGVAAKYSGESQPIVQDGVMKEGGGHCLLVEMQLGADLGHPERVLDEVLAGAALLPLVSARGEVEGAAQELAIGVRDV